MRYCTSCSTTFCFSVQRHVLYTIQGFSCRGRQMLASSPPPCPFCRAGRRVLSHQTPILGGGLEYSTIHDSVIFVQGLLPGRGACCESDSSWGSSWGYSWLVQRPLPLPMLLTRRRSGAQSFFQSCGWFKVLLYRLFFSFGFNFPLETVCRAKILGRDGRAQCRESLFLQTGNRLLVARDGARLGSATPPNHAPTSVMIEPLAFRGPDRTLHMGDFRECPGGLLFLLPLQVSLSC